MPLLRRQTISALCSCLTGYVKEQGEEEANGLRSSSRQSELFGGDPKNLFDLDRENAARVFVAPTTANVARRASALLLTVEFQ